MPRRAARFRALSSFVLAICLLACLSAVPLRAGAAGPVAERLDFSLRMFGVTVGRAELTTAPMDSGAAVRHLLQVRSNTLVDLFFPVHDRVTSLARADGSGSMRFSKDIREGGADQVYDLLFGHQRVQRFDSRGHTDILLPPNCQDPLSLYFALRAVGPGAGPGARRPVSDGRAVSHSKVRVRGVDEIVVPAGRFKAVHVVLEAPGVDGVFRLAEGEAVHLWITGDENLVPLRLAARVLVGPFTGNLRVDLVRREAGASP